MDQVSAIPHTTSDAARVPVVGIYGISGSGKSHLLRELRHHFGKEFLYFEGAEEVASLVDGGLEVFNGLESSTKIHIRRLAIRNIGEKCNTENKTGIVVGNAVLWSDEHYSPITISTEEDFQIFTHIFYLDINVEIVSQRCRKDPARQRTALLVEKLHQWQTAEKIHLRDACYRHGILFAILDMEAANLTNVTSLLYNFRSYSESSNLRDVETHLHDIMKLGTDPVKSVLLFDGDRTLSAPDTGALMWSQLSREFANESPLKKIFDSPLGYSHAAFRQAEMVHHENYSCEELEIVCDEIFKHVELYPQMKQLLQQVVDGEHSKAIVITCGLQSAWEQTLARHGFVEIQVLGSGRFDDTVIDPNVKAAVVEWLHTSYNVHVTAFGDSPVDRLMLGVADRAVVVVGDEEHRSKSMEQELGMAIRDGFLKPVQAIVSRSTSSSVRESLSDRISGGSGLPSKHDSRTSNGHPAACHNDYPQKCSQVTVNRNERCFAQWPNIVTSTPPCGLVFGNGGTIWITWN